MMHGQCKARPMVTFPFTGTNLHCLLTDAHVCEQLAQVVNWKWNGWVLNQQPLWC